MIAKSIAIVDVEEDVVNFFTEVLELHGYSVCKFTNPIDALEHIKKNPHKFCLILTDFRMPHMNGYELATKVVGINTNMKVIITSAYESPIPVNSQFGFINKPIKIQQLVQVIKDNIFLCN